MKHINIKIYGDVQGVCFRYYAKEKADKFGLFGFVRNEQDGTVYIEAEGEDDGLNKFLKWCEKGPKFAKVEKVELESGDLSGAFDGFEVMDITL
ncbi:acylphosphatase [Patescibacteria group bacterium]